MTSYYESEAEITAVVQGFESCTTPDSGFTHRAHVTVAVWYRLMAQLPNRCSRCA